MALLVQLPDIKEYQAIRLASFQVGFRLRPIVLGRMLAHLPSEEVGPV